MSRNAFGTTRLGRLVLGVLFIIMIVMMMPTFLRLISGGS